MAIKESFVDCVEEDPSMEMPEDLRERAIAVYESARSSIIFEDGSEPRLRLLWSMEDQLPKVDPGEERFSIQNVWNPVTRTHESYADILNVGWGNHADVHFPRWLRCNPAYKCAYSFQANSPRSFPEEFLNKLRELKDKNIPFTFSFGRLTRQPLTHGYKVYVREVDLPGDTASIQGKFKSGLVEASAVNPEFSASSVVHVSREVPESLAPIDQRPQLQDRSLEVLSPSIQDIPLYQVADYLNRGLNKSDITSEQLTYRRNGERPSGRRLKYSFSLMVDIDVETTLNPREFNLLRSMPSPNLYFEVVSYVPQGIQKGFGRYAVNVYI